jgi:hypothetical protein|tara:strand:+ start:254 stop:400 length:147 start_codon:yes stop_codon:yes gene_type:complete
LELTEIIEKLEEAVETENWDMVIEVINEIEIKEIYKSPYDDSDEETWG